jgi:hypothetical protein
LSPTNVQPITKDNVRKSFNSDRGYRNVVEELNQAPF